MITLTVLGCWFLTVFFTVGAYQLFTGMKLIWKEAEKHSGQYRELLGIASILTCITSILTLLLAVLFGVMSVSILIAE